MAKYVGQETVDYPEGQNLMFVFLELTCIGTRNRSVFAVCRCSKEPFSLLI